MGIETNPDSQSKIQNPKSKMRSYFTAAQSMYWTSRMPPRYGAP